MTKTILQSIYWFPVKGLPGIALDRSELEERGGIPNDRRFAITRGVKATGDWMPSRYFYINSYVDGMLDFDVEDFSSNHASFANSSGQSIRIDFEEPDSLNVANQHLARFISHLPIDEGLPVPEIVTRNDNGQLWDYPDTPISIINAASVSAIGDALGKDLDPLRFRGNLVISGMPAWEEFELMGKRIRIGEAELEILRPIVRCPTPGVNPTTGVRDIDFAKAMPEAFGHAYCGMYAVTVKPGTVSQDDRVEIIGDASVPLNEALAEAEEYQRMTRIMAFSTVETGEDSTRLSLKNISPWPIPPAKPRQRLRLHMGGNEWTTEYVAATSPDHYHLEVNRSETGDPITEKLRTGYASGDRIVVSGPFGRV